MSDRAAGVEESRSELPGALEGAFVIIVATSQTNRIAKVAYLADGISVACS